MAESKELHEGRSKQPPPSTAGRALSQTRLIALIPAFGLAICAFVLVIATCVDAIGTTIGFIFEGAETLDDLTIDYIEYTDMFLLGVVLFMTALGLCQLFVTDRVPLPKWLEFHDLDDLKERLVSVIVVMLGVHFLGLVLKGTNPLDLLWLGIAICVVIFALTLFTRAVFRARD